MQEKLKKENKHQHALNEPARHVTQKEEERGEEEEFKKRVAVLFPKEEGDLVL